MSARWGFVVKFVFNACLCSEKADSKIIKSVFPNIYRDMRHPQRYEHGLKLIFGFVTSVDLVMAIVGYLMYGRRTKDEITTNVLMTQEYPEALHVVVLILVAIIPLTKFPLK